MYFITIGDTNLKTAKYIYHPQKAEFQPSSASASFRLNSSETLTFTLPYNHPLIDDLTLFRNDIQLNYGNTNVSLGRYRIIKISADFYGNVSYECEGMFSIFNDTVVPPITYSRSGTDCVSKLLEQIIDNHNSQSDTNIILGSCTVTDSNNYVSRNTDTYKTTMEFLKEQFINTQLGGYFVTRYLGNQSIYLDYVASFGDSSQKITFGKNLLDLVDEFNGDKFYTAIYPLGAENLTIGSLADYENAELKKVGNIIYHKDLCEDYGKIVSIQSWDDVTNVTQLNSKAQTLLSNSAPIDSISVKALDLHLTNSQINEFKVGQNVELVSPKVNTTLTLSEKTIDILNPESSTITLGREQQTLTSFINSK